MIVVVAALVVGLLVAAGLAGLGPLAFGRGDDSNRVLGGGGSPLVAIAAIVIVLVFVAVATIGIGVLGGRGTDHHDDDRGDAAERVVVDNEYDHDDHADRHHDAGGG